MEIKKIIEAINKQKETKLAELKSIRHNVNSTLDKKYKKNDLLLVTYDMENRNPIVECFLQEDTHKAKERYKEIELEIANGKSCQAVLMSINEATNLKKAYPNFFLDTKDFIKQINKIISEIESKKSQNDFSL